MHNGDTEAKEVRPWAERRRIFIFASSASKAANELVRFPDPLTKSGCLQKSWTRQSTTMLVVGVRVSANFLMERGMHGRKDIFMIESHGWQKCSG